MAKVYLSPSTITSLVISSPFCYNVFRKNAPERSSGAFLYLSLHHPTKQVSRAPRTSGFYVLRTDEVGDPVNKSKIPKPFDFGIWSCWADLNRRPHPYQAIFGVFYNNFRSFLVIFIPNNIVSRTFAMCSLRCFHVCLWWNCGQTRGLTHSLPGENSLSAILITKSESLSAGFLLVTRQIFLLYRYRFLQTVYYRTLLTHQLPTV